MIRVWGSLWASLSALSQDAALINRPTSTSWAFRMRRLQHVTEGLLRRVILTWSGSDRNGIVRVSADAQANTSFPSWLVSTSHPYV